MSKTKEVGEEAIKSCQKWIEKARSEKGAREGEEDEKIVRGIESETV